MLYAIFDNVLKIFIDKAVHTLYIVIYTVYVQLFEFKAK